MFDCKQDIGLLHGSLLAAAYNKSLFECASTEETVQQVYDSIKTIIHHSLEGVNKKKKQIEHRLQCNERLHAAIFFRTLSSHGFNSKAAEEYYESILYNWPSMDFKFYLELSFKCDWGEYFIMCALQLPTEMLYKVLKLVTDISFSSDVEFYSWHLLIQILIYKLMKVPYDKSPKCSFDFDFAAEVSDSKNKFPQVAVDGNEKVVQLVKKDTVDGKEIDMQLNKNNGIKNEIVEAEDETDELCTDITMNDEFSENGNGVIQESDKFMSNYYRAVYSDNDISEEENDDHDDFTLFEEMYINMCNLISMKIEFGEIGAIKVLLHSMKTFLNCLIFENTKDDANSVKFDNLIKICKFVENYLELDSNQENLQIEFQKCLKVFESHAYATVSWKISLNYLVFLLEYYVDKALPLFESKTLSHDAGFLYSKVLSIIHSLSSLNYYFMKSDENLQLLCKIIQCEFQGSSYAASFFLADPVILERKYILKVMEENCYVINLLHSYPILIDSIVSAKSQGTKLHLCTILYKCLQMNNIDMYDNVLGYTLSKYGFTDILQLPDFNNQLSEFARQTPSLEEAKKVFPVLLVQNPIKALEYLIEEALNQGPSGKVFIEILKYFRHICFYSEKHGSVSALHNILNAYFNKAILEAFELKNMLTLYRFLVEVHSKTKILLPCIFFKECIVPKLYPGYEKLALVLECSYILLTVLLADDTFLGDAEFLPHFVAEFGKLVNHFILKRNGKMKSLIAPILKEFEKHQLKTQQVKDEGKDKLWLSFKELNEETCVYVEEFLPKDIEYVSKSYVWTWSCKNEDVCLIEENFTSGALTYASLVNILVEILPHFTPKEWLFCSNIVKKCCQNHKLRDEVLNSNNPFQLSGSELDTYAAILAIVTSLHFILNDNFEGSLYVSSCFSNCLKNMCQGVSHSFFLLSVTLEVCHLISHISPDLIHVYNATLLELKKEIIACSESHQTDCSKLLHNAVNCLPAVYRERISL